MKRIVLKLEYDGTDFSGWQNQPNTISVQRQIELAAEKIVGYKIKSSGAGRTDAGVHAAGQVAHFDFDDSFSLTKIQTLKAMNSKLPNSIRIIGVDIAKDGFHARFSACARRYGYYLTCNDSVFHKRFANFVKFPMDINKLYDSAPIFLGRNNFTAVSKNNPYTQNYICNVSECYWEQVDEIRHKLTIKADRFVYGMVRAVVGTMIQIARNKKTDLEIIESIKSEDRSKMSPLAEPCGLSLEEIYYPKEIAPDFTFDV